MKTIKKLRQAKGLTQSDLGDLLAVSRTTVTMWETGKHDPDIETLKKLSDYFDVPLDYLLGSGVFHNWESIMDNLSDVGAKIAHLIPGTLYMHEFSGDISLLSWINKKMIHSHDELDIIDWFSFAIKDVDFSNYSGEDETGISIIFTPQFLTIMKLHPEIEPDLSHIREVTWQEGMINSLERHLGNKEVALKIPVLGHIIASTPLEENDNIVGWEDISALRYSDGVYYGLKVSDNSMAPRICEGDVVIFKADSINDINGIAVVLVNGDDAIVRKTIKHSAGMLLQSFNPDFSPVFFSPEELENLPVKVIGRVVELRVKL